MRLSMCLLFLIFLYTSINAQQQTTVHIVTDKKNHLPYFTNFHFQVNGQSYKLKAGECIDIVLNTDSVHIIAEDKRWVKNGIDELHVAAEKDLYIWVRVMWKGNYRNPRYGAEIACMECYDELKKKCK